MTPRTLPISRRQQASYVLVHPPKEGRVHVCTEGAVFHLGPTACLRIVGDRWQIIGVYFLRGAARNRVSCAICRRILSQARQRRRGEET